MRRDRGSLLERAARLDLDGVDFTRFVEAPLDDDTLRCLRYMHDVESHTVCYLRDLLVTHAHADPEVTGFLSCWTFEEHWHGDAIARVLAAHGQLAGSARVAATRRGLPRRQRLHPLLFLAGSLLSSEFVTVLMAWGAVNEWTTQAGYGRLAVKAGDPVLGELLTRIMRQEGRHIDFYVGQARERLSPSRAAQRATRTALRHYWRPVGSSIMPRSEVSFLVRHLFGDHTGTQTAERIDRRIEQLPGLDALHLVADAVAHAQDPST